MATALAVDYRGVNGRIGDSNHEAVSSNAGKRGGGLGPGR